MTFFGQEEPPRRDGEEQRLSKKFGMMESGGTANLPNAEALPEFAPQHDLASRLNHLYKIGKIFAVFESLKNPLASVLAIVRAALPIRSVILIEEMEGRSFNVRSWTIEKMPTIEFLVAATHAEAMYDYFLKADSGSDAIFPERASQNFIVIPLAVGGRAVFGTLQVECSCPFTELDVVFINAIANQLAIALDLHDTRKREAETLRNLNEFVSIASHDLKSPIHVILAFSNLMREEMGDDLTPQRQKDYLAHIILAAERMNCLISDLLGYSKTGSEKIDFSTIDMTEMVHEIWHDMKHFTDEKKAQIKVESIPSLNAGRFQVRQLVQNLIGNAIKYSNPEVPPLIKVFGRSVMKGKKGNQPFVEISISDNGIGFDPKLTDKIFEPFERLHAADKYEGDGLGLAICRKVVERHGGTITADSREGQGSTFTFTLPAVPQESVRTN